RTAVPSPPLANAGTLTSQGRPEPALSGGHRATVRSARGCGRPGSAPASQSRCGPARLGPAPVQPRLGPAPTRLCPSLAEPLRRGPDRLGPAPVQPCPGPALPRPGSAPASQSRCGPARLGPAPVQPRPGSVPARSLRAAAGRSLLAHAASPRRAGLPGRAGASAGAGPVSGAPGAAWCRCRCRGDGRGGGAGPRALSGGSMAEALRQEPAGGPESEAELSQRLARTKARSYGSTASVAAPLAERYVEHRLSAGDTLQGIALKYGVTMEQIKRANKLFTNDCIFLRKTLNIPVISEKPLLFNGLNSLESPENETVDSSPSCDEGLVAVQEESSSSPSSPEPDNQPTAPEELSAKDFLQRLDLQIKLSKQAARKLKDDNVRDEENEEGPYATSSYHQ
uniref:LysM and putative peptidoglycan-binding domain-containing protein 2 n=2 Tax=Taeniopygia guttata TaxID=59729 RepID=H0Z962_TAEGU